MNPNEAAGAFSFASPVTAMSECDRGHINHTYFLDCAGGERYVLQHLNRTVFPDPKAVMANVVGVTAHIRRKLLEKGIDPTDRVLSFVPAGGKYYFEDSSGGYWRAYRFVSGACPEHCASPAEFARVGRAFGVFQNQLSDYDAATLCEVIPDFHNTPRRYEALLAAAEKDEFGRVADCRAEIGFARERAADYGLITDGLKEGIFPLRVTHNDTKLTISFWTPKPERGGASLIWIPSCPARFFMISGTPSVTARPRPPRMKKIFPACRWTRIISRPLPRAFRTASVNP